MRRRWRRDARPRRRGGPASLERPAGGAPVWGAGAGPSSDSRYTARLGCDDVVHDADACVVDASPLGEADLFQHALRGEVVGIGHGHEPRQPQGPERMADERARGFGGDPPAPAVACETIGQLDVVARRHPEQGAEAVGDAGTTLHEPEAQRRLILGDALSHPRGRLVGRSCSRRAAHVAHDFRVAVERDEVALVGGTQPSQPESRRLDHGAGSSHRILAYLTAFPGRGYCSTPCDRWTVKSSPRRPPCAARSSVDRPCSCFWLSARSEEHTSELQSRLHLVCRLLLEKKKNKTTSQTRFYK